LGFALDKNRPGAFVLGGPQHVGKTSAVFELEKLLHERGLKPNKDFVHVNGHNLDISTPAGTVVSDEIAVQDTQSLYKASALVTNGKRVILDVVNKQFPLGDPRNNAEIGQVLEEIFPHKLLNLKQLFAVQTGMEIAAKVPVRSGRPVDFNSDPRLKKILEEHQRHVQNSLKSGIFVAGETFISEDGTLITDMVWTGKPTYGSIDGQSITSYIDPSLF
jgi:hypothetical protein